MVTGYSESLDVKLGDTQMILALISVLVLLSYDLCP